MTAQAMPQTDQEHWFTGTTPDVLTAIMDDSVNLAVWERSAHPSGPTHITQAATALLADRPAFRFQESGTPSAVRWALEQQLAGTAGAEALVDDVYLLADMMATLFDHANIGVRLSGLNRAMCPRYHVDRVHCRLITTYVGPGMMWLPNQAVPGRSRQTVPIALPPDDALAHQHVATHAVALCKGDGWPGNAGRGLIHRSPQPKPGQSRLLLTLDLC